MKKVVSTSILFLFLFSFAAALTSDCNPSVQLLSQDPYPAVPGDYVKLVFQIDNISDASCGDISFGLANKYPLVFDPNQDNKLLFKSGTYVKDFSTHVLAAFKVRVDANAVDGENPIETFISQSSIEGIISNQFDLFVEDTRADFEIYVKNLDFTTNVLTLEVLNIADVDVKSIAVEVLEYPGLVIKGAKTKIIGDLDSNEYTSAEFEIQPTDTLIPVKIHYTDNAGFRRSIEKNVTLQTGYFQNRKADEKTTPMTSYIVLAVIIVGLCYWFYKKRKKAKELKKK